MVTGARGRWLFLAAAVLAVVAIVVVWNSIQIDRRSADARPVPTTTPLTERGVRGGTAATPSNTFGAPVPGPDPQASRDDSPLAPWWQRVPPVEGTLLPINRLAGGHVRIERVDDDLRITINDLRVATVGKSVENVRVVLSAGAVIGEHRGYWSERGVPYDVGSVPVGGGSVSVTFRPTGEEPDDVRSLVLFDADTGELLGGAALLPTD